MFQFLVRDGSEVAKPGDWLRETMMMVDDVRNRARNATNGTSAIDRAQRLGTFGQVDRSRQYQDPSGQHILESLNSAWPRIRQLEKQKDKLVQQISREKLKRWVTTAALLVAWELIKFLITLKLTH